MSCNCKYNKKFKSLEHVRILAQQMANLENEIYAIIKQTLPNKSVCFDFLPLKNFNGSTVEILQPVQKRSYIETSKSNRKRGQKASTKTKKL